MYKIFKSNKNFEREGVVKILEYKKFRERIYKKLE